MILGIISCPFTESIPENKHDMDSISVEEISTNNTNKDALIVKKSEQKAGKRRRPKSAVSQLHEYALRLKLNIEFEVYIFHKFCIIFYQGHCGSCK
jgi:ATP-dependent exoDNAse (exonuclease V) beta subunit